MTENKNCTLETYIATRYYYPHGIEGEAMKTTIKEFTSFGNAIAYARRYAKGKRFAGVQVEDTTGNCIYEITSDFKEIINFKKLDIDEQLLKEIKEVEKIEIYKNEDRKCECWKCELQEKCVYKDKYQRLGRENRGALGKCAKLSENKGVLQY